MAALHFRPLDKCLPWVSLILQMTINWSPGNTECLLQYRGKRATAHLQNRRLNGKLTVYVPTLNDVHINVVSDYQHLESIVALASHNNAYAKSKASSAMHAYTPIAAKVFGSADIPTGLKLWFLESLVLSQ